jgi:HPt (histidine-containing phosphotransfer) domain-containing protein
VLREKYKELGAQYVASTRLDLDLLQQSVAKGMNGDAASVVAARNMAHRICGSAAMLGFAEISAISRQIEAIMNAANSVPAKVDWSATTHLVRQLDTELHHAKQQSSSDA